MDLQALPRRVARATLRVLSPGGASALYVRPRAQAADFIRFPCHPPRVSRLEQWMIAAKGGRMTCTVCEAFTRFTIDDSNLRESCVCASCGVTSRKRQIAYVLSDRLSQLCASAPIVGAQRSRWTLKLDQCPMDAGAIGRGDGEIGNVVPRRNAQQSSSGNDVTADVSSPQCGPRITASRVSFIR